MLHIEITEDKREGKECFSEFDMAVYARKVFGMYSGKEERVKIHCENALAGVIIDRFGKDIIIAVSYTHLKVGFWWGPTFSDSSYEQKAAMKVPSNPICVSSKVADCLL